MAIRQSAGMNRTPSLDSELHPIATLRRLCGDVVADRFHDAFAGQEICISSAACTNGAIAAAIGHDAASALFAECGSGKYHMPNNRERRCAALFAQGKTANQIATELCLTTRGVRRLLRKAGLVRHQPRNRNLPTGEN